MEAKTEQGNPQLKKAQICASNLDKFVRVILTNLYEDNFIPKGFPGTVCEIQVVVNANDD